MKNLGWAIALFGMVGCGDQFDFAQARLASQDVVMRASAEIELTTSDGSGVNLSGARFGTSSKSKIIIITNPKATVMNLDDSEFSIPVIDGELEDLGYLKIGELRDNDLRVCGSGGTLRCGKAVIRMYTTGTLGAGLYNELDGYGIPLTASLLVPLTLRLGAANAIDMQVISIPATKRVVRLQDFPTLPRYNIKADFTEAGAGDFKTTLVIEYGLAL